MGSGSYPCRRESSFPGFADEAPCRVKVFGETVFKEKEVDGSGTMQKKRYSNVAGFDDAPFDRGHRGKVPVVGTVYAGLRLDGVLLGEVEKDGFDAAEVIADRIETSPFAQHIHLVLIQGIAFAGFNVVDLFALSSRLAMPVLVVARKKPDMDAMRRVLESGSIPHGAAKWALIREAGPMEPLGNVYAQRAGLDEAAAADVIGRFAVNGHIPEPLRTAHLIAGALAFGYSRGRV